MTGRGRDLLKYVAPPPRWRVPVLIAVGVFVGMALYVGHISRAFSYLSDAPETCVNCHIMAPQYATWSHSSHREVAHCNDCHIPHDSLFSKMYFKAKDGMRHSTIFTLRREPPVIRIHEAGAAVVQQNCIRCHQHLLSEDRVEAMVGHPLTHRFDRTCWECHRETPHGRVNSLASVPDARVPMLTSPVPDWLRKAVGGSSTAQEQDPF